MRRDQLKDLLTHYLNGTIQRDELRQLIDLMGDDEVQQIEPIVDQLISTNLHRHQPPHTFNQQRVLRRIQRATTQPKKRKRRVTLYWAAASVVGFLVTLFLLFPQRTDNLIAESKSTGFSERFLSTQKEVMLYLADGTHYNLVHTDTAILRQIGVSTVTDPTGETCFILQQTPHNGVGYHTVKNGIGATCQLQLADGSRIWLNASASLAYPTQFAESSRQVRLEGEAFFEVAPDPGKPFEVAAANSVVRVLGTKFNIANDPSKGITHTTLFEGVVKVDKGAHSVVLNPGWQATTDAKTAQIVTGKAPIGEVAAWRTGYFRFNDHTIEEVMDQLKTWYGIEHIYFNGRTKDRFTGSIKRSQKLTEVLGQLAEISNYTFNIQERSVYIMN